MKFFLLTYFVVLIIGCGNSTNVTDINSTKATDVNLTNNLKRVYGKSLNFDIEIQSFQNSTLYKPKDLKLDSKLPIVLFAPGWGSQDHNQYKTILSFIASQGYMVLYSKSPLEYSAQAYILRFLEALEDENISKYLDRKKIGIIGHSSGGGLAFKIMDYFSKDGYGEEGRFIFSMDPWFAFEMDEDNFKNFSKNTKVVIQQYMKDNSQDPRIALTIFDKLSVLGNENRDYQVYSDLTHGYPMGGVSNDKMQIILKPLDALMDYVFHKKQDAYKISMELGNDNPPYNPVQEVLSNQDYKYNYTCYGELESLKSVLKEYKINYCSIIPLQNN